MSSRRVLRRFIGLIAIGAPGLKWAQTDEPFHHFTLSGGAGLTTITGAIAGKLDHGGNIQLNGGYFFNRYIGISGNFMFSGLGITRSALDNLDVPDGSARVYAVTADPTIRLPLGRGFSAYLLAGGGYLKRTVELTQPTWARPVIFDPWWGYFGPGLVPIDVILGTTVNNSGAVDVGGGPQYPTAPNEYEGIRGSALLQGVYEQHSYDSYSNYLWSSVVNVDVSDSVIEKCPDETKRALRQNYRTPSVRQRMLEFLGGQDLNKVTSVQIAGAADGSYDFGEVAPPDRLPQLMGAGVYEEVEGCR